LSSRSLASSFTDIAAKLVAYEEDRESKRRFGVDEEML